MIPENVLLTVAALCLLAGGIAGWTIRDWKSDSDQLAAIEKADQLRERLIARADAKSADLEAQRVDHAQAATNTSTQLREIYRETKVPADCDVPAAAVGVLNNAVDRANSEAAGKSGGALPQPTASTGPAV